MLAPTFSLMHAPLKTIALSAWVPQFIAVLLFRLSRSSPRVPLLPRAPQCQQGKFSRELQQSICETLPNKKNILFQSIKWKCSNSRKFTPKKLKRTSVKFSTAQMTFSGIKDKTHRMPSLIALEKLVCLQRMKISSTSNTESITTTLHQLTLVWIVHNTPQVRLPKPGHRMNKTYRTILKCSKNTRKTTRSMTS